MRTLQVRFLLALVVVGVLPLGLLSLTMATLDRQTIAEQSTRELTGLARGLAGQIEVYLAEAMSDSRAIAALLDIASMDPARQEPLLKELYHHYSQFARLSTFGPSGQLLASSHPAPPVSIAERQSFQRGAARGWQAWEVATGLVTGRWVLLIHTPIREADRRVVGVLGTAIDLQHLSMTLDRVPIGGGGRAFVLDATGRLVLHPDPGAVRARQDYSWLGVPTGGLPAGPGTVRYESGGAALVAGYALATNVGWTVVVERPEAAVLAPAERSWRLALAGLAASTLLAVLVAIWLARRLTRPVRDLARAARAFGAGDSDAPLPAVTPDGQLGTLVEAFGTMRAAVVLRERELQGLADENAALARSAAESARRLRDLVQDLDAIVWEADAATFQFSFVSRQAEVMLGYPVVRWLGEADFWANHVHPDDREATVALRREATAVGRDHEFEYRALAADGRLLWLRAIVRVVRDAAGGPERLRGLIVDITERKRAEEALRHTEEQLRQAQKMEAIGQLAGGVAHDFNNLLTVINGFSELLLVRMNPPEPWHTYVDEIAKAGERAAGLTRQLLVFSRRQVLAPRQLGLGTVVADLERMLRRLIGEDVELITSVEPELGWVKADPSQMEQVIMNLAVNARDAMPRGGTLAIEVANVDLDEASARRYLDVTPGPYVMLCVRDTGIGMDAETLSRVFEPFFTTKEKGRGTGLGLSTVYGIVKQNGGHIEIASEPGQGATFKVYLPRVEVPTPAPEASRASGSAGDVGSETILVVEDEDMVRAFVRGVLQTNGYTVLEAGCGDEALEIAERHLGPIHLLLTDLVMPGLSGREVAERLVSQCPRTRVLYMSGYTEDAAVHRGVLESGMAFLQKPLKPAVLVKKVREVLDARREP